MKKLIIICSVALVSCSTKSFMVGKNHQLTPGNSSKYSYFGKKAFIQQLSDSMKRIK